MRESYLHSLCAKGEKKMVYTFYNPKVALMGAGCVKEIGNQAKQMGGDEGSHSLRSFKTR